MNEVTIDAAISLLLALTTNAGKISALITEAKANGQTTISADEWQTVIAADDAARSELAAAIS